MRRRGSATGWAACGMHVTPDAFAHSSHETPEASGLRCSTPAKIRKCGFTRRLGVRGGALLIFFTSAQNGRERKIPTAIAVRAPFV